MKKNNTLEITEREDYIQIKVLDKWTLAYAEHVIDQMVLICDKSKTTSFLLDLVEWDAPESELIRFFSGKYLAEHISGNVRISAFTKTSTINRFGEIVATNRGATFKIFNDQKMALQWLLE